MPSLKSIKTLLAFVLLGVVGAWMGCSDSAPVASRPASKATCALCDFLGDSTYTATDGLAAPESPDTTQTEAAADSTETEADADSTQSATVEFADANLERCVRKALDRPQGPLTPADLAALTELDASYKNIESLAGLQHATALQSLALRGNAITDVSPLASLINLRKLWLWGNDIADMSPLASLISLRTLSLWGNEITDVSPLARLTNLQWLQLGDNDIADISPLASLTNLRWLGVTENALSQHAANQQLAASMASGLRVEAVLEKYRRVETVQVYPEPEEPQEPVRELIALYYADFGVGTINRADPDGENARPLVTISGSSPSGIALDLENGKVYWTNILGNQILRADLTGANVDTLIDVEVGLSRPAGIALDVAGEKMYWAEQTGNKIQCANLDGTNVKTLVSELAAPVGIALDVAGGKMYWTDTDSNDTNRIHRANLDGKNVEVLVSYQRPLRPEHWYKLVSPRHIALDLWQGKMYSADQGFADTPNSRKIHLANLDGTGVETLVSGSGLDRPFGIALGPLDAMGEKKIYWTDWGTDKIQCVNLDGTNVQDLITTGLTTPAGIALEMR